MNGGTLRLRGLCLGLVAFAWPWGAYQTLPLVSWPVSALLLAILVVPAVSEAVRRRSPFIPFELAWPLAVIGLLLAIHAALTGTLQPFAPAMMGIVAFWSVYASPDSRETIQNCFRLSVLSCTAVAGISLFAQCRPLYGLHLYQVFPTAFDSQTGAMLAFPASLAEGALTLAMGALLAITGLAGRRRTISRCIATLISLCIIAAPLLVVIEKQIHAFDSWSPPAYWQLHPLLAVTAVATAWLAVRLIAKVLVAGYDERNRQIVALAGLPLLAVLFATAFPATLQHGHIFVLALAARTASLSASEHETARTRRWPFALACILLMPLFVWNVFRVDPFNVRDPRNYEELARQRIDDARPWPLLRALHFISDRSPSERRTWLWSARVDLRHGCLDAAIPDFLRALEPPGGPASILPPPSKADIEEFLEEVRDFCAPLSLSERGLAYERALVLAGQPGNALSLLRLRTGSAKHIPYAPNLFASALAELLWDNRLAPDLRKWSAGELLAVLESIEAHLARAPAGFPARYLPAVLMGYRSGESLLVRVWTPQGDVGSEWRSDAALQTSSISYHWGDVTPAADGAWTASLFGDNETPAVEVKFRSAVEWGLPDRGGLLAPPASFRSALLVLLP